MTPWHGLPARVPPPPPIPNPHPSPAARNSKALLRAFVSSWPILLLLGCNTPNPQVTRAVNAYYVGDYESSRQALRPLAEKTDENFVLNNLRLGSACLPDYHLDEAEAAFLKAYEVINSVGVNDGGRSLGAVLVSENITVFKGEPFERAMANFYLGMIYYMREDYNNARAAFENALFKLRDYVDADKKKDDKYRQVESDFALGYLMLAKSFQHTGRDDLAKANFDRLASLRSYLAPLADYSQRGPHNLCLVIDYGYAPRKVQAGDGSGIAYQLPPGQSQYIPRPRVLVNGRLVGNGPELVPAVDTLAMAHDRKWESIDTIRAIKSITGTGLLIASGVEAARGFSGSGSAQRRDLTAAAALAGAGLLLKATSQADVRHWEMLPRCTFVLPLKVPPGRQNVTVEIPGYQPTHLTWRNLEAPDPATGKEATYYFRLQPYPTGPYDWSAPSAASPAQSTAMRQ